MQRVLALTVESHLLATELLMDSSQNHLRCNVCDQNLSQSQVAEHLAGRNHSIKKKVAEYNEMNSQIKKSYENDTSVVRTWIRDLYQKDFFMPQSSQA